MTIPQPPEIRFMNHFVPEPNSGCWLWTSKTNKGYGLIRGVGGRYIAAHRLAWQIFRGAIKDKSFVCHRCDTPSCVNPDHLFLGGPLENMRDMIAKGRDNRSFWKNKTHCKQGHPFDESNTYPYRTRNGVLARGCRRCRRNALRRWCARGRS